MKMFSSPLRPLTIRWRQKFGKELYVETADKGERTLFSDSWQLRNEFSKRNTGE